MSYRPGDPYIYCPLCRIKKHRSELKRRYDKLLVCEFCLDPKPSDLLPTHKYRSKEGQPVKDAQGTPIDTYETITDPEDI